MSDDPASKDAFKWEQRTAQVFRLNIRWEGMGSMANVERAEAALTIEMLMREAKELNEEITQFLQQVSDLRAANFALNDEAKNLRAERDEARREACGTDGGTIGEAMLEAKQRGWDCFKEATDDRPR